MSILKAFGALIKLFNICYNFNSNKNDESHAWHIMLIDD